MRFALALPFVIGCGAGVELGGECDQQRKCEDGAVCDFTDPEGAVCIDADGDLDGDGIPNRNDFCNHAPGGELDRAAQLEATRHLAGNLLGLGGSERVVGRYGRCG